MKVTVRLREIPLGQLVASIVSALNVESIGSVIGETTYSGKEVYHDIQALHLYQSIERKPASAIYEEQEWKNHTRFLNVIGSFHWHPYTRTTKDGKKVYEEGKLRLGKLDKKTLREDYPRGIELLATINPARRTSEIGLREDSITACIEHNHNLYRVQIAAFYLDCGKARKAIISVKENEIISVLAA